MPFGLIQAGTALQLLSSDGTITTLTIPSTITLRSDVPPRWAIDGRYAVLVNTPSEPVIVDLAGVVRPLSPKPPRIGPIYSGVTAGALSGTYGSGRYTFVTKDALGNVISESEYSPAGNTVTIASKKLRASNLDISGDVISARRLYRPTTSGAILFPWIELDGNVLTSIEDDLGDAGLTVQSAPVLGTPPRLTLIAEWRGRLWGVGDVDVDSLLYCEAGSRWAWPASNAIPIPHVGQDDRGITALLPRRDVLGVGRQDRMSQIVGGTAATFTNVGLNENCGVLSQESVDVWNDTAFWLWEDGVYQWNDAGVIPIVEDRVRNWFVSDQYFNRSRFRFAFGKVDPVRKKYRLFLAAVGSAREDRWVEYDLVNKTWWGPHKTDEFTPSAIFVLPDAATIKRTVIGSVAGDVYAEQDTAADGASGITFDVLTKAWHAGFPDYLKHWSQMSVLGKVQAEGTLTITPYAGTLQAPAGTSFSYDMRRGRERQPRLGEGEFLRLRLQHSTINEAVELYGLELPNHIVGRR